MCLVCLSMFHSDALQQAQGNITGRSMGVTGRHSFACCFDFLFSCCVGVLSCAVDFQNISVVYQSYLRARMALGSSSHPAAMRRRPDPIENPFF